MKSQMRAMQLAGLSGFPFWGHDAGGFFDWKNNVGPDETLYQQWSAAFGSFAPILPPLLKSLDHCRQPFFGILHLTSSYSFLMEALNHAGKVKLS